MSTTERSTLPSRSVKLNFRVCELRCKTHDPMTVILVELYTLKLACTGPSLIMKQFFVYTDWHNINIFYSVLPASYIERLAIKTGRHTQICIKSCFQYTSVSLLLDFTHKGSSLSLYPSWVLLTLGQSAMKICIADGDW